MAWAGCWTGITPDINAEEAEAPCARPWTDGVSGEANLNALLARRGGKFIACRAISCLIFRKWRGQIPWEISSSPRVAGRHHAHTGTLKGNSVCSGIKSAFRSLVFACA